jgi:histidine triad (HIT) family protein
MTNLLRNLITQFGAIVALLLVHETLAQSAAYQAKKERLLKEKSPFEKIIIKEEPRELVYEDQVLVVFKPLRDLAPVHLLIVPKERINTLNDATDDNALLLGQMILVAKKMAKQYGIDETGYRLVMNTNENAGQSVFHIHLHVLGGTSLGPMIDQSIMKQ